MLAPEPSRGDDAEGAGGDDAEGVGAGDVGWIGEAAEETPPGVGDESGAEAAQRAGDRWAQSERACDEPAAQGEWR